MRPLLIAAAVSLITATYAMPVLAADVGVSVTIGQPGFYGRIDIGGYPQPQLVYPQPVVIERGVDGRPPIYLRVPPGHAKHWDKHCREYSACGEQVFFVHDNWYKRVYVPHYQAQHRDRRDEREERGERRDDRRGDRRDERHGEGHDRGR